jgi:hypothetical protein
LSENVSGVNTFPTDEITLESAQVETLSYAPEFFGQFNNLESAANDIDITNTISTTTNDIDSSRIEQLDHVINVISDIGESEEQILTSSNEESRQAEIHNALSAVNAVVDDIFGDSEPNSFDSDVIISDLSETFIEINRPTDEISLDEANHFETETDAPVFDNEIIEQFHGDELDHNEMDIKNITPTSTNDNVDSTIEQLDGMYCMEEHGSTSMSVDKESPTAEVNDMVFSSDFVDDGLSISNSSRNDQEIDESLQISDISATTVSSILEDGKGEEDSNHMANDVVDQLFTVDTIQSYTNEVSDIPIVNSFNSTETQHPKNISYIGQEASGDDAVVYNEELVDTEEPIDFEQDQNVHPNSLSKGTTDFNDSGGFEQISLSQPIETAVANKDITDSNENQDFNNINTIKEEINTNSDQNMKPSSFLINEETRTESIEQIPSEVNISAGNEFVEDGFDSKLKDIQLESSSSYDEGICKP